MSALVLSLFFLASDSTVVEKRPPTQSLRWESDGCEGESIAVVSGCPSHQRAPFVIRLRMVRGLVIPSHSHPIDENITVVRGELVIRILDDTAPTTIVRLKQGDIFRIPAYRFHIAEAIEETEMQTNGIGPLVTTWAKDRCKATAVPATLPTGCAP